MQDKQVVMEQFVGKKIKNIEIDGDYKVFGIKLNFEDDSTLVIDADGSEGAHLSVLVDVNMKLRF